MSMPKYAKTRVVPRPRRPPFRIRGSDATAVTRERLQGAKGDWGKIDGHSVMGKSFRSMNGWVRRGKGMS